MLPESFKYVAALHSEIKLLLVTKLLENTKDKYNILLQFGTEMQQRIK